MTDEYITIPNIEISDEGRAFLEQSLPNFSFSDFAEKLTNGDTLFKADSVFNTIMKIFADEMYSAIKILSAILALVAISSLLENLCSAFKKSDMFNSGIITVALISGLSIKLFEIACNYAHTTADDMTKIMWSILPVMMMLVSGSGFTTTGVITHPIILFMCNVFAEIFDKVLIPVSILYLALSLTDTMTTATELGKFRELIKKAYNFLLGIIMTLFTGMITIGSFAGKTLDSVGAKGVKFAVSNMVPFVGRSLSDAMGAVAQASVVLKNALGITGVVCIGGVCLVPVIKITVIVLSIRLCSALCEPIASRKSVSVLSNVANSLSMINAALIATAVMLIISLSLIVGICT